LLKDEGKRSSQKEHKRSNAQDAGRVCGRGCERHDRAVFVRITPHRHSFHTQPNISSSSTSLAAMAKSSAKYPKPRYTRRGLRRGRCRGRERGLHSRARTRGRQRHLPTTGGPALRADAARSVENPILYFFFVKTAAMYILMTHPASLVPAFSSLPAPSHTVWPLVSNPPRNRTDPSTPVRILLHPCCLTL
jgi:hypothetical protein